MTWLFGKRTSQHWQAHQDKISSDPLNRHLWEVAFDDFFKARLETRYLDPIRKLSGAYESCNDCSLVACSKHSPTLYYGVGFSIVAIQCSLVEFFQTTLDGWTFDETEKKKPSQANKFKYGNGYSKTIFTTFLKTEPPFRTSFDNPVDLSEDFYKKVRCSVLHEACTTEWRIRPGGRSSSSLIDKSKKILYWKAFQFAIAEFIDDYRNRILQNQQDYREAFIRKMNGLCK